MSFTRHATPDGFVVRFEGSLDVLTATEMHGLILDLLEEEPRHVVLDVASLGLIDGSGIAAVVALIKQLHEQGTEVHVENAAGQPLEIFKLLGLVEFLGIHGHSAYDERPAA